MVLENIEGIDSVSLLQRRRVEGISYQRAKLAIVVTELGTSIEVCERCDGCRRSEGKGDWVGSARLATKLQRPVV